MPSSAWTETERQAESWPVKDKFRAALVKAAVKVETMQLLKYVPNGDKLATEIESVLIDQPQSKRGGWRALVEESTLKEIRLLDAFASEDIRHRLEVIKPFRCSTE